MSTQRVRRMLRDEFPDAELVVSGRDHIRLRFPDGIMVTVSNSPSRSHWIDEVRRDVRRLRNGVWTYGHRAR
jgi:hypothetical protein